MRGGLAWDDDEIETRVFFKAEPDSLEEALPQLARGTAPNPNVMVADLTAPMGRYSIPSLANMLEPEPTMSVPRQRTGLAPIHIVLAVACALLGITAGALIALTDRTTIEPHPMPAPIAAPHPIVAPIEPAPAPAPAPAPVAVPALVDLHVESTPAGATVMLVGDAGATTVVGTTPVDVQVDPARDYDVLVKIADRAPRLEHVTAASNHHVAIAFDQPAAEPAVAAAPVARPHHDHAAASEEVAKGSLRIASKPPCSIAIDGHATGMTTPVAAIPLTPGHHSITLTNAEQGISLTKDVTIEADHSTSLIQNFLD